MPTAPIEMATNALDFTNPRVFAGFVNEAPLPGKAMGFDFLPSRDGEADKIWVEIKKQAARLLAPFSDVDAEAPTLLLGETYTSAWFDALQIKHKARFTASDMRWLRNYGDAPLTDPAGRMAATARQRIADTIAALNDAVDWRIEWLQMQALQGRVLVTPDDVSPVSIDISYPVTTKTASPLWDNASGDPRLDINTWTKDADLEGLSYTRMIAPRPVIYAMATNPKMLTRFATPTYTPAFLTTNQVKTWILEEFGIELIEYTAVYTSRSFDGTTITDSQTRMLAANKAILLPDEPVGYTYTVPQELKNYQTGKYTWQNTPENNPGMQDPPKREYGIGWGGMPVITFPKRVIVATVTA